jgi:hypothetical protein
LPLKCTRLCREVGGQVRAGKQGVSAETAVFKTNKILTPLTSMIDGYRVVIAQEAKPEVMPCEGACIAIASAPIDRRDAG